jgi:phenylpropionate dioxygenase-like ring-hydroxylating dioxygenase large terminal subunit
MWHAICVQEEFNTVMEPAMLTTQQPVFRQFWHAVMPLSQLADGPQPFTLLGENIVLFLDEHGEPAALKDRGNVPAKVIPLTPVN